LFSESQIGVAGLIGRLHCQVPGQGRRNPEFLLLPIGVGYAMTRWRFYQSAQPDARAEDKLGIARLIASGAGSKRRQDGAVTSGMTHRQIIEP
jgi:hypothetical protein